MPRPDPLAGLSTAERRRRVQADGEYILAQAKLSASQEGLAVYQASSLRDMGRVELWDGRTLPKAVVSARVDLDTPLYLPDNVISSCTDCDCDIQVRPDSPAGIDRLCICCAARRIREAANA